MGNFISSQAFLPPERHLIQWKDPSSVNWLVTDKFKIRIPTLLFESNLAADPVLIYCHGNAEDLIALQDFGIFMRHQFQVNFFAFEYPGYAGTRKEVLSTAPLSANEELVFDAAETALNHLLQTRNIDPRRVILFGKSIGSGPATELARRCAKWNTPIGGLILQSPIASAVRVVMSTPFSLPFDIFRNIDKIDKVRAPTTIIHGQQDTIVPVTHGEMLNAALADDVRRWPLWIEGAGHNDIEMSFTDLWSQHVQTVIDEVRKNAVR